MSNPFKMKGPSLLKMVSALKTNLVPTDTSGGSGSSNKEPTHTKQILKQVQKADDTIPTFWDEGVYKTNAEKEKDKLNNKY